MTGNTSRVRGRERELKVVRHYRVLGFVAYRLNEGSADVAALKAGHLPKLIQVKSTLRPYDHFRRADRDALLHDALSAGAEPVLAWWPKGGPLRLIPACEWPSRSAVRFPQAAAA
jgi:Holliday junction resolvase